MTDRIASAPAGENAKPDASSAQAQKAVSAEEGSTFQTLVNLWPYIWPQNRPDLKARVLLAIFALVIAKIVTVLSPYFFAWASDALTGETASLPAFLVAPVMLVLAYNAARILAVGFNQLRDALFAQVGQHAVKLLRKGLSGTTSSSLLFRPGEGHRIGHE